jgi:hypothetical protein
MSSKRHRHQSGTTPTTEAQDNPGMAQFSMSDVARFLVTPDISSPIYSKLNATSIQMS